MRVLSLDVGDKRIGVALSDPSGLLATPLTTIKRGEHTSDIEEVLRLAGEHDAGEVIVGMPISLSGRMGAQAELTARFAAALADRASIPVNSIDERYSTVQAERLLRESGVKPSKNKARVDAAAAAVILQSYLDSKRAGS